MRFRSWSFDLEDGHHRVELQHGWWSGVRIIRVDGAVFEHTGWLRHLLDFGSSHTFTIGQHECELRIGNGLDWGFRYRLAVDGRQVTGASKGQARPQLDAVVNEGGLTTEPIGEEERIIDNSGSRASVVRRLSITKEWNQSYSIERDKTVRLAGSVEGSMPSVLSFDATAEECLRLHYSVTQNIKKSQTEEVTIEVPPGATVSMRFLWKRVVRTGDIWLRRDGKGQWSVPFRIVVGITFDQVQRDA
jgi:hypothetical protein